MGEGETPMTKAEALDFAWMIAGHITAFLVVVAVFLLGFALLKEISR